MKTFPALLCMCCLLTACSKRGDSGDEINVSATPVQVATVGQKTIERLVTAQAILYPLQQANVVPKISAPVSRFLVQRGDRVHAGQLLAILENQDLTAAAQESKEMYQAAEASLTNTTQAVLPEDLVKAQSDVTAAKQALDAAGIVYRNRQSLVQQGALASRLLDDARVSLAQAQAAYDTAQKHLTDLETAGNTAQLKSAQAQAAAAKAHYENAAAQVSYSEVRSPINGIVSDRPVNVGEMAGVGAPLFSIIDLSRVVARANVAVDQAAAIRSGAHATLSGPAGELSAKVTVVSPAVDANTTTIQVWVEAQNPDASWKPGTAVQISIDAGVITGALVVPVAALLSNEEGGEKVMLAGNDGLAHEQDVKTGVRSTDLVQILNGVKPGDKVITQGALGLDDKAKISIGGPEHE